MSDACVHCGRGKWDHNDAECSFGWTPHAPESRKDAIVRAAGECAMAYSLESRSCLLCNYADHDRDGGERHEDECPLAPLDSLTPEELAALRKEVGG